MTRLSRFRKFAHDVEDVIAEGVEIVETVIEEVGESVEDVVKDVEKDLEVVVEQVIEIVQEKLGEEGILVKEGVVRKIGQIDVEDVIANVMIMLASGVDEDTVRFYVINNVTEKEGSAVEKGLLIGMVELIIEKAHERMIREKV